MTAECNAFIVQSANEILRQAFNNFISNSGNREAVENNIDGLAVKLCEHNIITVADLQSIKNKTTDTERLLVVIHQMPFRDDFFQGFRQALFDCKLKKYARKLLEEADSFEFYPSLFIQ